MTNLNPVRMAQENGNARANYKRDIVLMICIPVSVFSVSAVSRVSNAHQTITLLDTV